MKDTWKLIPEARPNFADVKSALSSFADSLPMHYSKRSISIDGGRSSFQDSEEATTF